MASLSFCRTMTARSANVEAACLGQFYGISPLRSGSGRASAAPWFTPSFCAGGRSNKKFWYRGTKTVDSRSIPRIAGIGETLKRYHLIVQPFFFCASSHSFEPGAGTV